MLIKSGLIKSLAATTALAAAALAASSASACEQPQGPCAGARPALAPPHAMHGPGMRGPGTDAYIVAPGPTPAYAGQAGGAVHAYDRYGGETAHGGPGWGGRYGEVHRAEGYIEPYTPAFGRGVVAERPYDGPGMGYRVEHGACGVCGVPPMAHVERRFIERRVHRPVGHRHVVRRVHRAVHARFMRPVVRREVRTVIIEREVPHYIERHEERRYDEGRVSPDFFYGGINGGAGYGVDGGNWGGGGVFADSGFGASAVQGFSRSFAGARASASASASAYAFAMSHGGKKGGHGGGCNVCGGGGHGGGKH